jgi:hypothetical protein
MPDLNKVFQGIAAKSKSSMGWFFRLKLHVIANEKGDLVNVKLRSENVDDRSIVEELTQRLTGSYMA